MYRPLTLKYLIDKIILKFVLRLRASTLCYWPEMGDSKSSGTTVLQTYAGRTYIWKI